MGCLDMGNWAAADLHTTVATSIRDEEAIATPYVDCSQYSLFLEEGGKEIWTRCNTTEVVSTYQCQHIFYHESNANTAQSKEGS